MRNFKEFIIEKLKVSKKNSNVLQVELRNFVTWYMYDNDEWNISVLKEVNFAEDTTNKYFNGSYSSLYNFICKHEQDVIYVSENKISDTQYQYMYSFEVDGIPFNIQAYVEKDSDLLSNQYRILIEKLKVTKEHDRFLKKNKLKDVVFKTFNIGSWRIFEFKELFKDARKEYFNDDIGEMVEFFSRNESREVEYSIDVLEWLDDTTKMVELYFIIDGKEFKEQYIEED